MIGRLPALCLVLAAQLVGACGAPEAPLSARWSLAEPRAAIYERACKTCHERESTGAPLARDPVAWRERVRKGSSLLLEHTIHGFGGMPPLGSCVECDERDLQLLVAYLAGLERPDLEPPDLAPFNLERERASGL